MNLHTDCIVDGLVPLNTDSARIAVGRDFDLAKKEISRLKSLLRTAMGVNVRFTLPEVSKSSNLEGQLDATRKMLSSISSEHIIEESFKVRCSVAEISEIYATWGKHYPQRVLIKEQTSNPQFAPRCLKKRAEALKELGCKVSYIVGTELVDGVESLTLIAEFNGKKYFAGGIAWEKPYELSLLKIWSSLRSWHVVGANIVFSTLGLHLGGAFAATAGILGIISVSSALYFLILYASEETFAEINISIPEVKDDPERIGSFD